MGSMSSGRTVIAAVTVLGAVAVVLRHGDSPLTAVGLVGAVVVLGVLADIDFRTFRLPNNIVGPFAITTFGWLFVAALVAGEWQRLVAAVLIGVLWAGVLLVGSMVGHVGMGDVKLAFPIGMIVGWLGLNAFLVSLVVAVVSSGLVGLVVAVAVKKRSEWPEIPYGPFLALGAVAGMAI